MLLLLDLDNTLVDRDGAFSLWASGFIEELGGSDGDLQWLLDIDSHGYTPRTVLADGLIDRFQLSKGRDELVYDLMLGHVQYIRCYDGVRDSLRERRAAGDELVIVTNGSVEQQSRKIQYAGLEGAVDRVVISESIGVKKPAPGIFATALQGRKSAQSAWMVGDHPENDIKGAQQAGCKTGWVTHGETWTGGPTPTVSAPTTRSVLTRVVETEPQV